MDLRQFIELLKENGELDVYTKPVSLQHEIGDILFAIEQKGAGSGLFLNVGKDYPVIGGVLSSMRRVALALGCLQEDIVDVCAAAMDNPVPPHVVENGSCQEIVIRGDDVDLTMLPIPCHGRKDSGPFVTSGIVFSQDTETGQRNVSYHRMELKGKDKMGIMINEWRHLKDFYNKAEAKNEPLPVSVAIGVNPCISLAAGYRYDGDEMELAGAFQKDSLPIVKSVSNDIYVPADAEIVIEGIIEPHTREFEGPLGEFTGNYTKAASSPVFRPTAMTTRKDAIYQTLTSASFEQVMLGNVLPREPVIKKFCSYASKNVKAVHVPPYGSGFLALIAIDKDNPGEPKNVAMAALLAHVNVKMAIVVDPDIDIFNSNDILWALINRVRPEVDIFKIPGTRGHELDPTSDDRGVLCKVGIDATQLPQNMDFERVVYKPVDLAKYR